MKKKDNKGFVLVETLVVTIFVAGVLLYLYIQFTNLNSAFEETYRYNTVEGLYALEDVKYYMEINPSIMRSVSENIDRAKYIDITDCNFFGENKAYVQQLFRLENIKTIVITYNTILWTADFSNYDLGFQKFINKIIKEGEQPYRLIAEFNNATFATVRFGV